jgi:hypothetical protein
VLPRLAAAGARIQFAFIDGWHTFHHTLVDFFFVDRMLNVGEIVIIDDVGYSSLCHFILNNRKCTLSILAATDRRSSDKNITEAPC